MEDTVPLLSCFYSYGKIAVSLIVIPLCLFWLDDFKVISISLVFYRFTTICLDIDSFLFILLRSAPFFLDSYFLSFLGKSQSLFKYCFSISKMKFGLGLFQICLANLIAPLSISEVLGGLNLCILFLLTLSTACLCVLCIFIANSFCWTYLLRT